jgi:hypothetical protein
MSFLFLDTSASTVYWDKKSGLSQTEWIDVITKAKTVYVGNLSFYSTVNSS